MERDSAGKNTSQSVWSYAPTLKMFPILHRPPLNTPLQHSAKQICQCKYGHGDFSPNYGGNKVNSRENTSKTNVLLACRVLCCLQGRWRFLDFFSMGSGLTGQSAWLNHRWSHQTDGQPWPFAYTDLWVQGLSTDGTPSCETFWQSVWGWFLRKKRERAGVVAQLSGNALAWVACVRPYVWSTLPQENKAKQRIQSPNIEKRKLVAVTWRQN